MLESLTADEEKRRLFDYFMGEHRWGISAERTQAARDESSQLRAVCYGIIDAARITGADSNALDDGFEILSSLELSVSTVESGEQLEFWRHDRWTNPSFQKPPHMCRESIICCAERYLRLPYRAARLERLLVDMLVALELYGFSDEMVRKPEFVPSISPLHQPHAVVLFLQGSLLSTLVFGGAIWLSSYLPAEVRGWIGYPAMVLLIVSWVLLLVALPLVWRQQRRDKARVWQLIGLMQKTYRELAQEGPVSSKRVRELAVVAADAGVVWPGGLLAILDDNIRKTGWL